MLHHGPIIRSPFGSLPPPGSAAGDEARDTFEAWMLDLLGDCRSFWNVRTADTTTSTDRSRRAQSWTYSKDISTWDDPGPLPLGSGLYLQFDGTDEEVDTPDVAYMSFGDGVVDQGFSVGLLLNADVNNAAMSLVVKASSATAEEWALELDSSGQPSLVLTDESAGASIGRRDATAIGTAAWHLLVATYDGSGASTGINVYVDAVLLDDTDVNSGTYVAMEDTAGVVSIGKRYTTQERFLNGGAAFAFVTTKVLDIDDIWALKSKVNAFYDLSL